MMKSFLAVLVLAAAQLFAQSGGLINGTRGFPQPNDGATGTTINTTAIVNSSGNAIAAGVTDTSDPTYIVVGGAGTTGNAVLASNGSLAPCKMDSTIASAAGGFYVINSTTVDKDCHAQSASPASGVWVIGFLHDGNTTAGSNSLVAISSFVFGSAAGVSSLTGDGALISNVASIGATTLTLANAPAHKVWMNNTGSSALPGYESIGVADLPTGIPNTNLTNSSMTLNTSAPLGGGGSVSLGGTLTLTCATCATDFSAGVSAKVANYTLAAVDDGKLVTFNGASLTATLPAAPPSATWSAIILNLASTNVTVSRNALQINGGASNPALPQFQALRVWTDGTNYFTDTVPTAVSAPITLTATSSGITVGCVTCGLTSNGLNQFAATTSAQLAGVLSDELGSGKVVFATALQGTPDANVLLAGTISGTGTPLCTDANGGATTSGCPGGSVPTGPTSPNGVPSILVSTPSGGVAGAATWSLSGVPTNAQTTTSYTIAAVDRESYVSFSNASAIAVTLPQAGTTSFANNFPFLSCDIGAGTATITPTTSTISFSNGSAYTSAASSMTLATGQCAFIYSDNTNYFAVKLSGGLGTVTSIATTGPLSGGTITTTGTLSCPTCVTSAAALTNNAVVIGGGLQASSTISADTTTTHALFATAGAPAFRAMATGDLPTGIPNANLANASFTENGATCTLGSSCAPYGGVVTYTANHTIGAADIGKLVVMNCSGACTLTFKASPAATDWFGLESVGSTTATVSLNSLTYNASASVPALNNFHALLIASDGTNYFGDIPFITGTNMTLTYASNGLTVASTGGGGGVSSFTGDGTVLSNSGSTGAVTDTLASATAGAVLGNATNASAAPTYHTLSAVNAQTTTYSATTTDFSAYKTITVASGTFTITLPINSSQPAAGQFIKVINYGSGVVTVARNGQNLNGGTTSLTLGAGSATAPSSAYVISNGTDYFATTNLPTGIPNGNLANSSLAYNGQTVSLGSTSNVNAGATAHSVAVNEGAGAAIAGAGPGTSGQVLKSAGSGADPTYVDFPSVLFIPAANCNNTTAGAGWGIGSGGTVTCRAGTNNKGGFISITDTSTTFATFQVAIPEDWDSGTLPYIRFDIASTDAVNAHTIIPSVQVACYLGDGSTTDDVAANAAHSLSTITLNGSANRYWSTSNVQLNSTDMTGCSAGSMMQVTVGRATDTATNAEFYGATMTFPMLIAVQAN